jgi:hypothetical protein
VRNCGVRVSDFGFLSDFGDRAFGLSSLLHGFSHPSLITPGAHPDKILYFPLEISTLTQALEDEGTKEQRSRRRAGAAAYSEANNIFNAGSLHESS